MKELWERVKQIDLSTVPTKKLVFIGVVLLIFVGILFSSGCSWITEKKEATQVNAQQNAQTCFTALSGVVEKANNNDALLMFAAMQIQNCAAYSRAPASKWPAFWAATVKVVATAFIADRGFDALSSIGLAAFTAAGNRYTIGRDGVIGDANPAFNPATATPTIVEQPAPLVLPTP